ncbi:MAG: acyl--CoA ligase [Proteobacteria bacterium]|nr:acyl--CoA ligase [Pseudomonadota bacterium]
MNITAPIRRFARMTPDAPAIIDPQGGTLTYAMLERALDVLAHHAAQLGLRPGDIVGLDAGGNTPGIPLLLMLALARIGVATARPDLPGGVLKLTFQYGPSAPPGAVAFDATWLTVDPAAPPIPAAALHDDPEALFRLFASSGTTGAPKHVPFSHALMTRRVFSRWLVQGGGRQTNMMAFNLGAVPGCVGVLATLWQGGTVVLFQPDNVLAAIEQYGVEGLRIAPTTLQMLLEQRPSGSGPLPCLREITVSGSRLPDRLRQMAEERLCPNVVCGLGSTEVQPIAIGPVPPGETRPDAIGFVAADATVQAVDAQDRPLPPGHEGILRVRSPTMADRYFNDPDATAAHFRDGWFYPGDVGIVWPDGLLSLTGRVSDVINLGGDKYHPVTVEAVLQRFPGIRDAAVFAVENDAGVPEMCAAVVSNGPLDENAFHAYAKQHFPGISFAVVVELAELPRNAAGKVQRERLVALVAALDGEAEGDPA